MRVMLTGATGFVGSWIARVLIERGYKVRGLVRKTSNLANLQQIELEQVEGDVLDRASVRRALKGCEAVIHTAGIAHFRPGDPKPMYEVNVSGVEIVLGEALKVGIRRAAAAIGG